MIFPWIVTSLSLSVVDYEKPTTVPLPATRGEPVETGKNTTGRSADACLKLRGDRAAKNSPREVLHNLPRNSRPLNPASADGPSSDIPFSGTSAFFIFKESAKGNTGMRRRREAELTPENPSRSNDLHNPGPLARGSTVPFKTGRSTIADAQPPAWAGWLVQDATFNQLDHLRDPL
ncbi:hypothetical protein [Syntrophobacter fumaroxidans]|uniref:hypothetical protein n=1 Tax=Syntrophobacter fumaroxidans TaxID=119484 RepID=UPI0012372118|nr:hypothetical protein [Syntrophobacter fumaroxidans]